MDSNPTSYIVTRADRAVEPVNVGSTVYQLREPDYGLARHDTRIAGMTYTSITLDPNGGYPFFTIPMADLEEAP